MLEYKYLKGLLFRCDLEMDDTFSARTWAMKLFPIYLQDTQVVVLSVTVSSFPVCMIG